MGPNSKPTTEVNTPFYRNILYVLLAIFAVYNFTIYTIGTESTLPNMNDQAVKGQILWQENNCTACHQLYGLGGQLGPDLTNIISTQGKGPGYVKAFVNSGIKWMPLYDLSDDEKDQLVAFLSFGDETGFFPNKNAKLTKVGWVELEYKENNQ